MHRILIIDDEPSICKALTMGLSSPQMVVHSEKNGKSGVDRACRGHYDVLIVDLYLPDMSGFDVIHEARKCNPGTNYIIITAYSNENNYNFAAQAGVKVYLEKPVDMKRVKNAVMNSLPKK